MLRKCNTTQGQGILIQNQAAASSTLRRCTNSDVTSNVNIHIGLSAGDGSFSPSKSGHEILQSLVEDLNMETTAVFEVLEDIKVKEAITTRDASNAENHIHHASIDDRDEMKIDCSLEANHSKDMEVTVEDQKHERGDSNINLPNLSLETTDLLRKSGESLSPETVRQDCDQESRLEFNETEHEEGPSISCQNTLQIKMEEKVVEEITMEENKEGETEKETNHQVQVQYSEGNYDTKSGKMQAKRSRVPFRQLRPFKPFLLQSCFKRTSKREKHRRT